MSNKEILDLDLTFEVSYSDMFGKNHTTELVTNGANIQVTKSNLEEYIDKYTGFFMKDGIAKQVDAFITGFNNVIGGNALSLFLPEEIQLLLCGNDDHRIDVDVLKSVTKYIGWRSSEDAVDSKIITWFWDHMNKMSNKERKAIDFHNWFRQSSCHRYTEPTIQN